MSTKMTYEDIFKVLFSEQIEEYVPDGISISHSLGGLKEFLPRLYKKIALQRMKALSKMTLPM